MYAPWFHPTPFPLDLPQDNTIYRRYTNILFKPENIFSI